MWIFRNRNVIFFIFQGQKTKRSGKSGKIYPEKMAKKFCKNKKTENYGSNGGGDFVAHIHTTQIHVSIPPPFPRTSCVGWETIRFAPENDNESFKKLLKTL